jgi:AraC family transcriptional regulator of adaptative response / DNA-3-methyladenine glycosylase II
LRFLQSRAIPGVEVVEESSYRRSIEVDGQAGTIELQKDEAEASLLMIVRLPRYDGLIQVVERARRIFDLGADPLQITEHLRRCPILCRSVETVPGLRVPGAWDGFELAVRAVLGQQVSVKGATTLAGRLARRFGHPLEGYETVGLTHLFPRPEALIEADLSTIGITAARAKTIRALAQQVYQGEIVLDASQGLPSTISRLCAIPGIGHWTANYIAMRAFGETDAFPAEDLWLRRALANDNGLPSTAQMTNEAEAWRPWRAYAAMHLWASFAATETHTGEGDRQNAASYSARTSRSVSSASW